MRTIHKYQLDIEFGWQEIHMPQDAEIISVAIQNNLITIWAMVETNNHFTHRAFMVFGTGHIIEEKREELKYIGTVTSVNGQFVHHIFEDLSG